MSNSYVLSPGKSVLFFLTPECCPFFVTHDGSNPELSGSGSFVTRQAAILKLQADSSKDKQRENDAKKLKIAFQTLNWVDHELH